MNRSVLIQQIYPDTPGVKLLELTKEHHAAYCNEWHIDYKPIIANPLSEIPPEHGSWGKIKLIQDALNEYEQIYWLDADTLIWDFETDITDAVQAWKIAACWHRIPQGGHWNVGALYVDNCDATNDFIDAWLASYPPPTDGWNWMEQGVFNKMARAGNTVVTASDRWNATLNVNMVPDAVVLGFHGYGDTETRYQAMKQTLDKFAKKEAKTQAVE